MNLTPMLAEAGPIPWLKIIVGVAAVVFDFFVIATIWARR